jgi:hypothetical protein
MSSSTDVRIDPVMSAEDALERLECIDLGMVRRKLADPEEGQGWSAEHLDLAEREYRRFLALHLMYPETAVVPCGFVDEVWHAHILDTQAYGPDCQAAFGFFLHHFPYFGMRDEQDATDLRTAYDETLERYERAFGEPASVAWTGMAAKCRTKCKPMKCK